MRKLLILFGFALLASSVAQPRKPEAWKFPDNISISESILARCAELELPRRRGTFAVSMNNCSDLSATSGAAESPACRRAPRLMKSTTCSGRG